MRVNIILNLRKVVRRVAYQSKLLEELFNLRVGQVSDIINEGKDSFAIVILRDIHRQAPNKDQLQKATQEAIKEFAGEIMNEYNSYLLKLYPVEVNDKFLGSE